VTRGDDPLGKRALFSPAPAGPAAPATPGSSSGPGRRAMFSAPTPIDTDPLAGPVTAGPVTAGPVAAREAAQAAPGRFQLECRSCGVVTPLGVTSLVRTLVPSVWVPLLPWSRVLRCPACARWTRARLSWWPRPAATPGP
jgi:hypothetical protein